MENERLRNDLGRYSNVENSLKLIDDKNIALA